MSREADYGDSTTRRSSRRNSESESAKFWRNTERYHDLAQMFEQNIEYDRRAYDYVTSRGMCPCLEYCNRCSFPLEGKVVRIRYRGPNI